MSESVHAEDGRGATEEAPDTEPVPLAVVDRDRRASAVSPSLDVEVSLVLPAYNEEATLEKTVGRTIEALEGFLPAEGFEVIIAEDGCDDRTPELAAELASTNARVRHHHSEERLGRGRALEEAFREAEGETLVYLDTDLATDLRHLEELVEGVRSGGFDIATGSRTLPESEADRPVRRGIPSRVFNGLVRTVLRSGVRDHQCGFKAFDREALFDVLPDVEDDHWFWDTEVLVRAQRAGYAVKEFPVAWTPRGDTSVELLRDGWSMGTEIVRTWWQLRAGAAARRWRALVPGRSIAPATRDEDGERPGSVAVVTDYPPDSRGLAEHGSRLADGYREHADGPVTVFAPAHDDAGRRDCDGPVRVVRNWEADSVRDLVSLARAVRAGGYDVVHFNMKLTLFGQRRSVQFLSHLLPPVTRLVTGAVVVTTIHDLYELYDADGFRPSLPARLGATLATQLLLASHVVTVTTEDHRAVLERKYLRADAVHHLPHGLYTEPDAGDPRTDGPFRVLVFGYLSPYKDYDTLFAAFERLAAEDVELWIAGAPHPDHPETGRAVAERCVTTDGVRYVGYVHSDDLADLYGAVDVQVLPHRTCPGSSGSFRMAKTFRTPTVLFDVAELDRFLAGEDVERVPVGDPDALAACLERLADDPARLDAMAGSMQRSDDPTIADNARAILTLAGGPP